MLSVKSGRASAFSHAKRKKMHPDSQSVATQPRQDDFQEFELHCLRMVAEGLSLAAISQSMSLPESDIEGFLREAENRLGARNRLHAVSLALKIGILDEAPANQGE